MSVIQDEERIRTRVPPTPPPPKGFPMSQSNSYWRIDRPAEGFYTTELPSSPCQTVRTFLPEGYEPRYPYPLLVLFHGHGQNEEQVLRLAPRVSRRNFVAISLRGPELLGTRLDGRPCCGWGDGLPDADEIIEESVVRAVEQTRRTYHIHSERVYLVGVNEGAKAAYQTAFKLSGRIAGIIALNGQIPRPAPGTPLFRLQQVRKLRVLIGHGIANVQVPLSLAERDHRLLYAAGADVTFHRYPTTHRLHPDMLKDVNRWVIGHVNAANPPVLLEVP
jgi:phospholipase/carboxylesterase